MSSTNNFDLNVSLEVFPFDLNELPLEFEEVEATLYDFILEDDMEVEGEPGNLIIDIDLNNEDDEHGSTTSPNEPRRKQFLSNEERVRVYNTLLERSVNGKPKRNTTSEVASLLSVPIRTVQRIWKRAKETPDGVTVDVSHTLSKRVGRKRVIVDLSLLSSIPLRRRKTLRALSEALGISYGTLYTRFKEGLIRRHSNAIKPLLKAEQKMARLEFCLSMLDRSSLPHDPKFVNMYNTVHIDEKWFYMTKKSKTYYLLPEEDDPHRSCQSKNFIGKVMFLAAVARPRFDEDGNEIFSGKIGIFPLVTKQPAVRRSRNRVAGTLETKPILSVTKDVIRSYLIEKIIPAIQAKWPIDDSRQTIFIHQDNARTHIRPDDEQFLNAASQNGFDIKLRFQPANSPDLNVLDLGFFNAIQSLQDKECATTMDGLIHAVEKSFQEYPTSKINRVFLTLQWCMKEILGIDGENNYKIPHKGKDRLERNGILPKQIQCEYSLVENAMNVLTDDDHYTSVLLSLFSN